MKKLFKILLAAVAILSAFAIGRAAGMRHVLNDAEYFITDAAYLAPDAYIIGGSVYDPGELPADADFSIGIAIDGDLYVNYGFIG